MAVKLTLLLSLMIFATLFFAGDPDVSFETAENDPPAGVTAAPAQDVPDTPHAEEAEVAVVPEDDDDDTDAPAAGDAMEAGSRQLPDLHTDTDAAVSAALADEAAPDAQAETAERPAELGGMGIGGDGATAVSLADAVRNRTQAEQSQIAANTTQPSQDVGGTASAAGSARVTATAVNLRAGPSTADAVVGRVGMNDEVDVIEANALPGWSAIRDPSGSATVYIASQFLAPVE